MKFRLSQLFAHSVLPLICLIANLGYAESTAVNATKPLPQDGKIHVYLCGTGVPNLAMQEIRKPACLAIIADNQFMLFDAGEGASQTLAALGLPYTRINPVFITHWHSDHFAGLGQIMNSSWMDGRTQPLNVYGPYGIEQVLNGLNQAYYLDTIFRSINSQNTLDPSLAIPIPHLVDVVTQDKVVYQQGDIKVTAFEVDHAPVYPAVGYRLEYKGCKITISGDTKIIPKEAEEAKNADVFISEVLNVQQTQDYANAEKAAGNIADYKTGLDIPNYHSNSLLLAQIAQQAQVKNLVLTHFVPPFVPGEDAKAKFIAGMAQYYKGPIIAASDRDQVILTPTADGQCQVEYEPYVNSDLKSRSPY